MVSERNRSLELINYIKSKGIDINIGKNKALGNKGFFKAFSGKYRIDISEKVPETEQLKVLIHEFIHFIHYSYDKTLKKYDFLFDEYYGDFEEDLIKLTVDSIPKCTISPLFAEKNKLRDEIKNISNKLKIAFPDFKTSYKYKPLEKLISKTKYKYLLKYDRVKVIEGFCTNLYSVDNLTELDDLSSNYLILQSKLRALKRINSRISRLNKYYATPSELIARSFEYYVLNEAFMKSTTPNLYTYYSNVILNKKLPILTDMINLLNK